MCHIYVQFLFFLILFLIIKIAINISEILKSHFHKYRPQHFNFSARIRSWTTNSSRIWAGFQKAVEVNSWSNNTLRGLTGRRQIPLFVAAKGFTCPENNGNPERRWRQRPQRWRLQRLRRARRHVTAAARWRRRGARRRRRGVSLREGLNDVVVLAFQLQYVCSKGIYHIY